MSQYHVNIDENRSKENGLSKIDETSEWEVNEQGSRKS